MKRDGLSSLIMTHPSSSRVNTCSKKSQENLDRWSSRGRYQVGCVRRCSIEMVSLARCVAYPPGTPTHLLAALYAFMSDISRTRASAEKMSWPTFARYAQPAIKGRKMSPRLNRTQYGCLHRSGVRAETFNERSMTGFERYSREIIKEVTVSVIMGAEMCSARLGAHAYNASKYPN